jgi:hypothetical protein
MLMQGVLSKQFGENALTRHVCTKTVSGVFDSAPVRDAWEEPPWRFAQETQGWVVFVLSQKLG